ncbi:YlmH/Sll1252 family protein [Pseudogracilibacillus sp. SE30717A]|uniref:YlmH family RNA-binding protein n=1 Tax=Pseudogracilibacillus sp. SE30717A TaxID=3098293 RepID=UPI00300E61C0
MSIYQHFRKHEHPFVDQVLSWKEQVERTYSHYLTDFLDPREQQIVSSLIGSKNETMKYSFFGGGNTERGRALIVPFYEEISEELFNIILLEGRFDPKFNKVKHRDILGAFMSLGIERRKLGDIFVADDYFQLIAAKELSTYIMMNLTQINNVGIRLKEKNLLKLMEKTDEWITSGQTVSSLRLDVIVKEIYRMSRKDAVQYIKGNKVKVNFTDVDDPSMQVIVNDLISVRGYGRSKIITIDGKTRKDKIKITTAKLKA